MRRIGIYVFDQVELLDFAGPFEVFTTASRVALREHREPPFEVTAIGPSIRPVLSRAGVKLVPDVSAQEAGVPDILLVPGGVMDRELTFQPLLDLVARCSREGELVASVCTGAFVLAVSGLLDGRAVTTHWEDVDELRRLAPAACVVEGVRYVDEGEVVTSAGISAGIDMALHLVARFDGIDFAHRVARQMEYAWEADS